MASDNDKPQLGAPPQNEPFLGNVPRRRVYDIPATGGQEWEPPLVRVAQAQSSVGQPQMLADLCRQMETDEAYSAAMRRRVNGLIRSKLKVLPRDNEDKDSVKVAMFVEGFIDQMIPNLELRRFVSWYHQLSTAIATLDWNVAKDESTWVPSLRTLNPRWTYYDVSSFVWRFTSYDGVSDVMPGDGTWVQALDWMYGRPMGIASELALQWTSKQFAIRDWMTWSDFYAWPPLKAKFPSGGSESYQQKLDFVNSVKELVVQRVIGLPSGTDPNNSYDVEALKLADKEYEGFQARIEYADRKMQISWLGGNLSSEVADKGAYAASRTHDGVEKESLQGDAKVIARVICEQVIRPFVVANFGTDELCPTLEWTIFDEEDAGTKAKAISDFSTAMTNFKTAGYEIDNIKDTAEAYGLILKKATAPETGDAKGDSVGGNMDAFTKAIASLKEASFVVDQDYVNKLAASFGVEPPTLAVSAPTGSDIFQYDISLGVVTINEARAHKGLPPIEGGDKTLPQQQAIGTPDDGQEDKG